MIDIAWVGMNNVKDIAEPARNEFTFIGYGSMGEAVRLDPPRSKNSRIAVLLIQKVELKTLYMQQTKYTEH